MTSPGPEKMPEDVSEATQRVALYLHAARLEKITDIQRLAAAIVELARANATGDDAGAPTSELAPRAIHAAIDDLDRWLDTVLASCGMRKDDAEARGLLLWQLPAMAERNPAAVAWEGPPPEELRAWIRDQLTPVIPASTPGEMRPQEFGDVPPPLRARFWRRISRRVRRLWNLLVVKLTGRK
jgi:hypothetical protein